jgi:hypothetical protein
MGSRARTSIAAAERIEATVGWVIDRGLGNVTSGRRRMA